MVAGVLTADDSKRCGRIGAEHLCGAGYLVVNDHAVARNIFPKSSSGKEMTGGPYILSCRR